MPLFFVLLTCTESIKCFPVCHYHFVIAIALLNFFMGWCGMLARTQSSEQTPALRHWEEAGWQMLGLRDCEASVSWHYFCLSLSPSLPFSAYGPAYAAQSFPFFLTLYFSIFFLFIRERERENLADEITEIELLINPLVLGHCVLLESGTRCDQRWDGGQSAWIMVTMAEIGGGKKVTKTLSADGDLPPKSTWSLRAHSDAMG